MNLFKKATATIALVTLVSGIFSAGVSANSSTEIEAANALASKGYIVDHSDDSAAYNLNQNVLRQEIAAVARGIAGLDKKTTCDESFTDVTATTPNTWACYSVEALLDADLIAANTMFKPENNISKAEAVGMMVKAAFGDEYSYDAAKAASWQEQVVEFAVSKGIVSNFTNYDTAATRGFVFEAGNNAIIASDEVAETCDEVSQLLGLCGEETETETETETPVVSGDNVLVAELSATTPAGEDLPYGVSGVSVLSFDVTAGSEDVSITGAEFERIGFGEAAADAVAVYTEEGRASKVKDFNSSDDTANVTFSPAVVIKAGETRTLTVKVNTTGDEDNNGTPDALGEFAVELKDITASSTVDAGSIVSNYFEVKDVEAVELFIQNEGVNSSVKAGEEQADVAEFRLTNSGNLSTDVDVTVTSITLKEEGSVDQEDILENLTLTVNGDVISTVASMEGKYVTFNFDPIVIEDDKNETFTVKADVMGGAGEDIQFVLDSVLDITTTASKYNVAKITGSFDGGSVSIDAGELTIYAIDAEADEIRADKDNVILGQLKVVNVAGKNLELKNLGFQLTADNGSGSGVAELVENVEFEVNGTSYDLTASGSDAEVVVYKENDLDITLPQGTTIFTVRADTKADLNDNQSIELDLIFVEDANNSNVNDLFTVIETEDDTEVEDITPATLAWDKVVVKNSAATISNVPLANVEVVRGATDLVALQFEIEAGKASYVTADEIKVKLWNNSGSTAITKTEVSEVALYKGSVSESNLLDKVSASKFSSGVATFDGFEVEIPADESQTFIVTVSTTNTDDVIGTKIAVTTNIDKTYISLEDDENDVVYVDYTSNIIGSKVLTVKGAGELTLSPDANNTANKDAKTILAGEETIVYSIDAIAQNEKVNVEQVTFTLTGATNENIKKSIASAKLYLDNTVVATATNSDVVTGQIVFKNINDLDIPTTSSELKLAIVTETIGYEKVGAALKGLEVYNVEIASTDAEGVSSGEDATINADYSAGSIDSASFDIVPATVVLAKVSDFNGTRAKFSINMNDGNNTATGSSAGVQIDLQALDFVIGGNYAGDFKLYVDNKSSNFATGAISNGIVTFDSTDFDSLYGSGVISSSETFVLEVTGSTNNTNVSITLPTDAATYKATNVSTDSFDSNMTNEVELGSYTY